MELKKKKQPKSNQEVDHLKFEENKSLNDLNRIMNGFGNKKSFRDVDEKFNG